MTTEPTPEPTTTPEPEPVYDGAGHTLDYAGEPIHVDVDPIIPTGLCRYCN